MVISLDLEQYTTRPSKVFEKLETPKMMTILNSRPGLDEEEERARDCWKRLGKKIAKAN